MIASHLARFEPLSLDELIDGAELLTRVDRKYVMTTGQAAGVLAALPGSTRVLEIDGRRTSAYESVYFDTPELTLFHMCVQQRRQRIKVRTRCYRDSGEVYLEAKTRQGDATVKQRTPHSWAARARPGREALRRAGAGRGGTAPRRRHAAGPEPHHRLLPCHPAER